MHVLLSICLSVCMNAYISAIVKVRDTKFGMKLLVHYTFNEYISNFKCHAQSTV